jgi:hypothetical protein
MNTTEEITGFKLGEVEDCPCMIGKTPEVGDFAVVPIDVRISSAWERKLLWVRLTAFNGSKFIGKPTYPVPLATSIKRIRRANEISFPAEGIECLAKRPDEDLVTALRDHLFVKASKYNCGHCSQRQDLCFQSQMPQILGLFGLEDWSELATVLDAVGLFNVAEKERHRTTDPELITILWVLYQDAVSLGFEGPRHLVVRSMRTQTGIVND